MIIGIYTDPCNKAVISQFPWIQQYKFHVVSEDMINSITTLVYHKAQLYEWLRQLGNVVVLGYAIVDSDLSDITAVFLQSKSDLVSSFKINYFNWVHIDYDLSNGVTEEFEALLQTHANTDMKEGVNMSNIEDSLKKAMADLGLDEILDEPAEKSTEYLTSAEMDLLVSEIDAPPEHKEDIEPSTAEHNESNTDHVVDDQLGIEVPYVEVELKSETPKIKVTVEDAEPLETVKIPKNPKTSTDIPKPPVSNEFILLARYIDNGIELLVDDSIDISDVTLNHKTYKSLKLVSAAKPTVSQSSVSKPTEKLNTAVKTPSTDAYVSQFSSADELIKEKQRLDKEIAEARFNGDEDKVAKLRQYRRKIRRQINAWGEQS